MNPKKIVIAMFCMVAATGASSQYYSDRPLEMSFEQSEFFFTPSFLNPLGSGGFRAATVLASDNPLVAIERNPANLARFDKDTISSNLLYIDFRNNRQIVNNSYNYIFPYYGYYQPGYRLPGWGFYHAASREELTPVLSAAWIGNLPVLNNSLSVGITYQLINQSGRYYAIPHNIYRNIAGQSFDGVRYSGTEQYQINDRFSASDDMYVEGHALNLFAAWKISDALELGIKAGGFLLDRDGSVGSDNLWNQQPGYDSYWSTFEKREQEYSHTDFAIGINYGAGRDRFGIFGGLVRGSVVQNLGSEDRSESRYGHQGGTYFSNYNNWHKSDQGWDHSGNTLYSGLRWEREIRDDLSFRLMYNYSRLWQDLLLAGSIENESDNEYYSHGDGNYFHESEGFSKMHDFRTGSGDRSIVNNSIQSAIRWKVAGNQTLSVGAIVGVRNQSTFTTEKVDAFAESYYNSTGFWGNDTSRYWYYYKTVEDKTINWEFDSRMRSVQIPVIYEYDRNERFSFMLGINRVMNFWKTENTTLVLYDYRERVRDEESKIEQMVGERITEPRERLSIVTTSLLGGITFSPSRAFSIQLIASPGFEKNSLLDENKVGMQFWLGMKLNL